MKGISIECYGAKYVFELPAKIVLELSQLLNPGNCWEEIGIFVTHYSFNHLFSAALLMPGIQDIDIEACHRLSTARDGQPTETLLRIWGSKGFTILDLYRVFFRAKLLRCIQILLPLGIVKIV